MRTAWVFTASRLQQSRQGLLPTLTFFLLSLPTSLIYLPLPSCFGFPSFPSLHEYHPSGPYLRQLSLLHISPPSLLNPISYASSLLSSPAPLLQLLQSLHTAIANHLSTSEQPNILDQQPGRIQEVHSSCKAAPDSLGLFSHPE